MPIGMRAVGALSLLPELCSIEVPTSFFRGEADRFFVILFRMFKVIEELVGLRPQIVKKAPIVFRQQ